MKLTTNVHSSFIIPDKLDDYASEINIVAALPKLEMSFFNSIWSYSQPAKPSADPETGVGRRENESGEETNKTSDQGC